MLHPCGDVAEDAHVQNRLPAEAQEKYQGEDIDDFDEQLNDEESDDSGREPVKARDPLIKAGGKAFAARIQGGLRRSDQIGARERLFQSGDHWTLRVAVCELI